MACGLLVEVENDCTNNLGGVQISAYEDQSSVTSVTVDPVTEKITAAVHTEAFKPLYFKRNQAKIDEEGQIDLNEGSSLTKGTLTFSFKKRNSPKRLALKRAGEGQRDLAFIVKDGNGLWWYMPNMQLATKVSTTNMTKAEGSKYDVTFTSENENDANEITEAVALAMLEAPE